MFKVTVREIGGHVIVTVVDEELVGKRFEEGGIVLDVSESFFEGEKLDEELTLARMQAATSLFLIGERAVKLAIEAEMIHPEAVKRVKGVPYAQMLVINM